MLANPPKQNRPPAAECKALYYFPEIPCGMEKRTSPPSNPGRFVGMSPGHGQNAPAVYDNLEDSPQVCEMLEEAFEKGVAQGRTEAAAAQQEIIESAAAALGQAVAEMARIRRQECQRTEAEIVRLALAISKKIIGHAAEYGQVIETVVKAAMQKVADRRQLTLKLNPQDLDTVAAFKQQLQADNDSDMLIELHSDESISRGGCIIEAQLGDVDARIEQQVKIIEAQLLAQLPRPTDGD